MIRAYDEKYVDDAMKNLGEAVDYVVNQCKMDMDTFFQLFIASRYAQWFGSGVPKYVSGFEFVLAKVFNCNMEDLLEYRMEA